ncbi:hypothetical protein [Sagittula sp. SSi028]|uniref:hypothetical protein n=1 Tax=Sagittula sp. SSi028 TaxID=3400636 RepID=UPI003AF5A0B7
MVLSISFFFFALRVTLIAATYIVLQSTDFYRGMTRGFRRSLCLGFIALFMLPIEILSIALMSGL